MGPNTAFDILRPRRQKQQQFGAGRHGDVKQQAANPFRQRVAARFPRDADILPRRFSASRSKRICVVFPAPSTPSNVTNNPDISPPIQ